MPWSPSIRPLSRRGVTTLALASFALFAACGGNEAATPTTGTSTTPAAATTPPSTVPAGPSRDAREAVLRCHGTLDSYLGIEAPLAMDDYNEAVELCEEAALQLEVDGGNVQLAAIIDQVNYELDTMGDIDGQDYDGQLAAGERIVELARRLELALNDA